MKCGAEQGEEGNLVERGGSKGRKGRGKKKKGSSPQKRVKLGVWVGEGVNERVAEPFQSQDRSLMEGRQERPSYSHRASSCEVHTRAVSGWVEKYTEYAVATTKFLPSINQMYRSLKLNNNDR